MAIPIGVPMIFLGFWFYTVLASPPVYTNSGDLDCDPYFAPEHPIKSSSDCDAAIALIPSGKPEFRVEYAATYAETGTKNPLGLTWSGREQLIGPLKISIPAAFISGSCMVLVRGVKGQTRPPKTSQAASLMGFYFWPNVIHQARKILQECVQDRNENGVLTQLLLLDGWSWQYVIVMLGAPKEIPTSRSLSPSPFEDFMLDRYNIYTATGRVNGNTTTSPNNLAQEQPSN